MKANKYSLIVLLFIFLNFLNLSCSVLFGPGRTIGVPYYPTYLHAAVANDNKKLVKELLDEEGMDVNITGGEDSLTALFYVNSLEMAEFLVSRGAKINVTDEDGDTPLHWQIRIRFEPESIAIIRFLLEKGVDIDAQNKNGETPLYRAVYSNVDLARFLFEKGANPYIADNEGNTPLSRAKIYSRWHTFSLNSLIEDFEAYTPPDTAKSDTSDTSDTKEPTPDIQQSDTAPTKSNTPY